MTGPNAADAVVNLHYPGETRTITLRLVPVSGTWRIYDLSMGEMKRYRADLLKVNKDAAAQHPWLHPFVMAASGAEPSTPVVGGGPLSGPLAADHRRDQGYSSCPIIDCGRLQVSCPVISRAPRL
jgi:hypothetical protein